MNKTLFLTGIGMFFLGIAMNFFEQTKSLSCIVLGFGIGFAGVGAGQ